MYRSQAGAERLRTNRWSRAASGGSITEIAKQFPGVDFSLIETDEDTWWNENRHELDDEVQVRCCRTDS